VAAAADKTKKSADKDKTTKPRSPLLVTALVAVLAAGAAGGGVWYFTQSQHDDKAAKPAASKSAVPAPAQYFGLEPPFVVNLNSSFDGPRDPAAMEAIKLHAPAIRAKLLMLFSQVEPSDIADRAGKERLQASSLAEVQKLLKAETGKPGADELLFTSFVTQ